jgi:hypothetical protein
MKPRRMGWAGLVTRMRKVRNAYRNFVGEPEGKVELG